MMLKNITKKFDDKIVLDSFTAVFPSFMMTSLTGPSGSGKTTILRIIANLDNEYKGKLIGAAGRISFAFQEPRLFPGATVIENVSPSKQLSDKSADLLLKLGISENDLNLLPSELSGGMAKRVSLARAIMFPADIYLLDEPFAGLDDSLRSKVADVIIEYLSGKTTVISTHDTSFALRLDKMVTL